MTKTSVGHAITHCVQQPNVLKLLEILYAVWVKHEIYFLGAAGTQYAGNGHATRASSKGYTYAAQRTSQISPKTTQHFTENRTQSSDKFYENRKVTQRT
jgi:hypothetical protein